MERERAARNDAAISKAGQPKSARHLALVPLCNRRSARRAAAASPPCARHPRRIQLPAARRHAGSWPPHESYAPDVDELRIVSHQLAPHLLFKISACSGSGARARRVARAAVDWRNSERWRDVRRDPVDAPNLVACEVGVAGSSAGGAKVRHRELLDEQLLGRSCRSCGRRVDTRRDAPHRSLCKDARCFAARPGTRDSR